MTETERLITALRDQLAGLLSQIDTRAKPRPTEIIKPGERNAGAVWRPARQWVVRALNDDVMLAPTSVYLTTPEHFRSDAADDFDAITTDEARRLAMAILAAADWADGLAAGVTPLDDRRCTE